MSQLGNLGTVHSTMERMVGIEAITILAAMVVSLQHRLRVPSCAVQVGVVGRETASFSWCLVSLKVFVCLSISWIQQCLRVDEVVVGS